MSLDPTAGLNLYDQEVARSVDSEGNVFSVASTAGAAAAAAIEKHQSSTQRPSRQPSSSGRDHPSLAKRSARFAASAASTSGVVADEGNSRYYLHADPDTGYIDLNGLDEFGRLQVTFQEDVDDLLRNCFEQGRRNSLTYTGYDTLNVSEEALLRSEYTIGVDADAATEPTPTAHCIQDSKLADFVGTIEPKKTSEGAEEAPSPSARTTTPSRTGEGGARSNHAPHEVSARAEFGPGHRFASESPRTGIEEGRDISIRSVPAPPIVSHVAYDPTSVSEDRLSEDLIDTSVEGSVDEHPGAAGAYDFRDESHSIDNSSHDAVQTRSDGGHGPPSDLMGGVRERRVREINADNTLSETEKNFRIQEVMTLWYRLGSETAALRKREQLKVSAHQPSWHNAASLGTGEATLGCQHYPRNCKIQAKCCGLWCVCRLCHDDPELGLDHTINRHETENVMCMVCMTEQPVSNSCIQCRTEFARYFCTKCKFYVNSVNKDIYHCDKCGICRVGKGIGIDNFHCDNCNACVSMDSRSNHNCIKKSLDANCPICHGYLFSSTEPVIFMRCGHTMHALCFDKYTKKNFVCPLCNKSLTDMSGYYKQIDVILEQERMPPEYDNHVSEILCYDCHVKSKTTFHFVYHKCRTEAGGCGGYNTRVLRRFVTGNEDASPTPMPIVETEGPHPTVLSAERDFPSVVTGEQAGGSSIRRCEKCQAPCEDDLCSNCKTEPGSRSPRGDLDHNVGVG